MGTSRSVNTMQEGLMQLNALIAELKTYPDADVPWLIGLETTVLGKMKEPIDALSGQFNPQPQPGMGQPQQAIPGGMGPGGAPLPPPSGMGGGMGGGMPNQVGGSGGLKPSMAAPNPDEIRRMLK